MGLGLHDVSMVSCKTCTEPAARASREQTGNQQVNANVLLPNGFAIEVRVWHCRC
jgi:hypothetical protein